MKVTAGAEHELIVEVLSAFGAAAPAASAQARWLVEADLRDQGSHGLQRLPVLAQRMQEGLIEPNGEPVMSLSAPALLAVDGRRGFGPVVGMAVVSESVRRVRQSGIVLAAVRSANHLGILAPYAEAIAAEGLIGIVMTTSEALVHPFAGRIAMVGTNPLAIAVPADPEPLVLDMATGQVSMGRILRHMQTGQPIPAGWAVDAEGAPTNSAAAAARGAISPFGGAKGFGLGLALEVLVATLTGTALGREVHGTLDTEHVCNKGDVFITIDPAALSGPGPRQAASAYLDLVRATPSQDGAGPVRVPGDRARAERSARLSDGIELPDEVWQTALELAQRTGAANG